MKKSVRYISRFIFSFVFLFHEKIHAKPMTSKDNQSFTIAQMDPFNADNRANYFNNMDYQNRAAIIDQIEQQKAQHHVSPPRRTCRAIVPNMPHAKFPGYPHPGRFAVTPSEAQAAGIATGCANVMFQLDQDGRPINAHVVSEEPGGYGFGEAALEAVQGEGFKTVPRDGSWYGLLVQVQP